MESTQQVDARTQTSINIRKLPSQPTLHGVGRTGPHPTSSTFHHLDQPPADTKTVGEWLRELPAKFVDTNEGVMEDLKLILRRYVKEVELVAGNHQQEVSAVEVLEQLRKFQLWTDGERDLDRRLVEAPTVRESLVSDLTGLVLLLSTGIKLFRPAHQHALVKDTHRIVEHASQIALIHLKISSRCSPINILEFLDATKIELKSRIENLYDLLPTTHHLPEPCHKPEPRQVQEAELDKRRPFDSDGRIEGLRQSIRALLSTVTPASGSSSNSYGAENSRRSRSNPFRSSKKQSPSSTNSPSIPSIFSDNGTHGSVYHLTGTITSTSSSEAKKSKSEPTNSDSTRASSSCKKCKATFSDPAELENHLCHTHAVARLCRRVVQLFGAHLSQHEAVKSEQLVKVWSRNGEYCKTYLAIIDTGSDENLILHSRSKELDLATAGESPMTLKILGGHHCKVSELVQPTWKFCEGSLRHQEFRFFVVPEIASGIDMVLGKIAMEELGIHLCNHGNALIAQGDWKDLSPQEQEQQRLERQDRDVNASQSKRRQALGAKHAELIQKRDAANAGQDTKAVSPTSQRGGAGSGDVQRR